jgi:ornithine decarboxylase
LAQKLELQLVGVAFHVGSGSEDPEAFASAVDCAKQVSCLFPNYGFQMEILDIGGGFPGIIDFEDKSDLFYRMADVVNQSLDQHFPPAIYSDLKIISEPGKYFVASAFTLLTKVVGKRVIMSSEGQSEHMYYLNDGIFGKNWTQSRISENNFSIHVPGSFLIKLWEPELIKLVPVLSDDELESRKTFTATFW